MPPFRAVEFVRCQILVLGDQRQTKGLVTYCSILELLKMESLIDWDIAFLPSSLSLLSLIQPSSIALVFSLSPFLTPLSVLSVS